MADTVSVLSQVPEMKEERTVITSSPIFQKVQTINAVRGRDVNAEKAVGLKSSIQSK